MFTAPHGVPIHPEPGGLWIKKHVPFTWHDVDLDRAAHAYVESVNDGDCRIPTIVFIDGSILVEPDDKELENKLQGLT